MTQHPALNRQVRGSSPWRRTTNEAPVRPILTDSAVVNGGTIAASESISESISGSLATALSRRQAAARARRGGAHGYVVRVLGDRTPVAWCYDLRGARVEARAAAGRASVATVHRVEADGSVSDEVVLEARGPDVVATVTALYHGQYGARAAA